MRRDGNQEAIAKLKSIMVDDFPIDLDRRELHRYTSEGTYAKGYGSIRFELVANRGVHFVQALFGHSVDVAIRSVD